MAWVNVNVNEDDYKKLVERLTSTGFSTQSVFRQYIIKTIESGSLLHDPDKAKKYKLAAERVQIRFTVQPEEKAGIDEILKKNGINMTTLVRAYMLEILRDRKFRLEIELQKQ